MLNRLESQIPFHVRSSFLKNPESGLGMLFKQFYNPYCRYATQIVNSTFVAEELVKNVFFQYYRTKAFNRLHVDFLDYLLKSVKNECYTYLNLQTGKHAAFVNSIDSPTISFVSQLGSTDHYTNLLSRLSETIQQLSAQNQQIFSLSWYDNKNYLEIGQKLNISPKSAEIQLLNIIKRLTSTPIAVKSSADKKSPSVVPDVNLEERIIDKGYRARIRYIKNSKFEKIFYFNENSRLIKPKQIVLSILKALGENLVVNGDRMPSIDVLSTYMKVSRDKVQKAYMELREIGILTAIHGNGYFIFKPSRWDEIVKGIDFENLILREDYQRLIQSLK
ncbi:sigma-70 family RNA polymerase sigma factor [Dyadobacter subterraneus]|uniref:Sigma-70 family RNA polymerase sigma factor n=1 Tax=Dyadobacter subterraneus TaxID=2773304 RepID=A0ABR9WEL5_9BACT|nr:sigma-70 family RNA polymerase sigma factor [Dyadobacter subterraneus]MBE9463569.1 sigma-70 family RNA polymerase sigma factor [Dyadobacter subterraneus]